MNQKLKKLLSMVLCMAMLLGMFPALGLFEEAEAAVPEPTHTAHGDHTGWTPVGTGETIPATGNVYLTGDIDLSAGIAVDNLHLCLNGHTINTSVLHAFTIATGKTLTLCDCSAEQTGKIDAATADPGDADLRSIVYLGGGTFVMHGGTITGAKVAKNGGGVYAEGGTVFMYGGTITGNTVTGSFGGGIGLNSGAQLHMYGGTITKNTGKQGAGIWVHTNATATMYGGVISENTAATSGAAVHSHYGKNFIMKDGTITGNICNDTSDGSCTFYGNAKIMGGTIELNGKCTYGFRVEGKTIEISGGTITGDAPTKNLVFLTGATSVGKISGNPVIGQKGIKVNTNVVEPVTVSDLRSGASIYAATALTCDDTVAADESASPYHYTYKTDGTEYPTGDCGHDHGTMTALQGDVETLAAGSSYYLTGDVKLTAAQTISGEVHICLNGHTITGAAAPYLKVDSGAKLTVCDCAGGGKIDGSALTNSAAEGLVQVLAGGTFKFHGGTITGHTTSNRPGGVLIYGQMDMYAGAAITNCHGYANSGAFFIAGGTFNMYGGEITHNSAARGGAAWFNSGSIVTIYDGLIAYNKTSGVGGDGRGGAFYNNGGTFVMQNGEIRDNVSINYGGALFNGEGTITISGGLIADNYAATEGGATYGGMITINGGKITGNTAPKCAVATVGGAGKTFTVTGGEIVDNNTTGAYPDIRMNNSAAAVFSGTAVLDQGGIDAFNSATITIQLLKNGASIYTYNNAAVTVIPDGTVLEEEGGHYTWKKSASYGMTITAEGYTVTDNLLKLAETAVGSEVTLKGNYNEGVTVDSTWTQVWTSDNENVAEVDDSGKLTIKAMGAAKITVAAVDAQGNPTDYYSFINLQVGEYLRVLAIGNDSSRDSMFYLDKLGKLTGNRIQAAYLYQKDANMRDHALNLATNASAYQYYVTDLTDSTLKRVSEKTTAADVLAAQEWDIIILSTGTTVGWPTTYNSDVEYLVDYVRGEVPGAKLYWNMTWANELGCDTGYAFFDIEYDGTVDSGYAGDPKIMYNAIVDAMNENILVGEGQFDGRILTGTAIQTLRGDYTAADNWTRDGYHLSFKGGRLVAAMTMLKELIPDADLTQITVADLENILVGADAEAVSAAGKDTTDSYVNNQDNLEKIVAAVTSASATGDPAKLTVDARPTSSVGTTVVQTTLPVSPRFPDVVTMDDGTLVGVATMHIGHSTWPEHGLIEGTAWVEVFSGSADGLTWNTDEPLLVIDEAYIEKYGIAQFSDRYDRIKADPSIATTVPVALNVGDFNMEYFQMDMDGDGDKEQVLLATVAVVLFAQNGTITRDSYLVWSYDNGKTWQAPQKYTDYKGQPSLKRGDAAVFEDDRMIMTTGYGFNTVGAALWQWNVDSQKWALVAGGPIPNTAPEENGEVWNGGEIALITLDDETVYAFCRPAGVAYKMSMDDVDINDAYKWTANAWDETIWTEIANEDRSIHQPVFTKLDDTHILVNWASGFENPRDVYGKVFNINADWTDYPTVKIHDYATSNQHDTGNPGSTVLADGRVLVLHYDTEYDSLIANFIEPMTDEAFMPIEIKDTYEKHTFLSVSADQLANGYTAEQNATGSHTVDVQFVLKGADSSVTIKTVAGDVVITPTGVNAAGQTKAQTLALNTVTNATISIVGADLYIKVWQGNAVPAQWTRISGAVTEQKTGVSAVNAELKAMEISKRMTLELQESISGVAIGSTSQLNYEIKPMQSEVIWVSSNPAVAPVDQNGVITFKSEGTATISLTAAGITVTCEVTVEAPPIELSGEGDTREILTDDFEGYEDKGNLNDFLQQLWALPEAERKYFVNNPKEGVDLSTLTQSQYNIVTEGDNQYLELKGGYSGSSGAPWFMAAEAVTGDFTMQYDVRFHQFTGNNSIFYNNLWQHHPVTGSEVIWCQVQYRPGGAQMTYKEYRADQIPEGETNTAKTYGEGWLLPSVPEHYGWNTIKVTRINGAVFVKFWAKGEQEPAEWSGVLYDHTLDTSVPGHYRWQPYSNTSEMVPIDIDNIQFTQQVVEPTLDDNGKSLTLGGLTNINAYYTGEGMQVDENGVVTNAGVLVWNQAPESNDPTHDSGDPALKQLVKVVNDGVVEYKAVIDSMPAARYADSVYYRSYIQLADGSYEYGDLIEYSVKQYCENMLGKEEEKEELKTALAAKLYYGGAAEKYFGTGAAEWVEDLLGTYDRTEQLDTAWNESYLDPAQTTANTEITATGNVTDYGKSLYLKDNVYVKFYFKSEVQLTNATVCFWKNVDGELTLTNSKQVAAQGGTALAGGGYEYYGVSDPIPAAELGETIYACLVAKDAEGNITACSGVIAYSAEQYASNMLNKDTTSDELKEVVKWMVVYGERAKELFAE